MRFGEVCFFFRTKIRITKKNSELVIAVPIINIKLVFNCLIVENNLNLNFMKIKTAAQFSNFFVKFKIVRI